MLDTCNNYDKARVGLDRRVVGSVRVSAVEIRGRRDSKKERDREIRRVCDGGKEREIGRRGG